MDPPSATPLGLFKVRDVNWADPDIVRAGVIPIAFDGTNMWIGLGVSMFASTINTIGGAHEVQDHDLLDTAVREYNEEVGPNMQHIVPESVINCYAIKTSYTIQILLPIRAPPTNFKPTEELYTMIWITPGQLQIMNDNQSYGLGGTQKSERAYAFSGQIREVVPPLVTAMRSGIPYQLVEDNSPLSRLKREVKQGEPRIVTDIETFESDAQAVGNFRGHVDFVLTRNYASLMRLDRTIYIIPIKDLPRMTTILNKFGFKVMIGTNTDFGLYQRTGTKSLKSLEDSFNQSIRQNIPQGEVLLKEFMEKLRVIRMKDEHTRITEELNLLEEYENKSYELIQAQGVFFSERRACFLATLSRINSILLRRPLPYNQLKASLQDSCKNLTVVQIMGILINTGILLEDRKTTMLTIPS